MQSITSQYQEDAKNTEENNQQNESIENINSIDNSHEKTILNLKDYENLITSSKNMDMEIDCERNMKFIDKCVKNNEDEEIQLLKRKKFIDENEDIIDWFINQF